MSETLIRGIQIPVLDLELLNLGKCIAIPYKQFLSEGDRVWLCPSRQHTYDLPLEQCYSSAYQKIAQNLLQKYENGPIHLKTWAHVDQHWHIYNPDPQFFRQFCQGIPWEPTALQSIFEQYEVLKILILRVYHLPAPSQIQTLPKPAPFHFGTNDDRITKEASLDRPVLTEASFQQRKALLLSGKPYPHHRLENLSLQLQHLPPTPQTQTLQTSLSTLLGWHHPTPTAPPYPDWMNTIAKLGNRSKDLDEGKNSYEAGTDFENIVRQSLEFLGFTIDYSHKGGAGGLDLFCSQPYPIVGECKSGKKIPNDTTVQLLNLGVLRLGDKEAFYKANKLIIGPGEPTEQVKGSAKVLGMSIMNPETLEKIVKLHHIYPIDLFKLQKHLIDGQVEDSINQFIAQTHQAIQLRAYIIKTVKTLSERSSVGLEAGVDAIHAVYSVAPDRPQPLEPQELRNILIELSSPLLGYLGHKTTDGTDHFYYLRDLPQPPPP